MLSQFLSQSFTEYTHMKLGLDRVRSVLNRLGRPDGAYDSVLIAGTNGKGSVGRILESVLVHAGHPVGLYTSPHLERFNERIRIGGEEVTDSECETTLVNLRDTGLLEEDGTMKTLEGEKLTWFEKVTVLAFEIFRRRKIKLALLEVGLGGRLDATNVAAPLVSAITSIGLDHREVLGNSLFEIAREKAGVMRTDRPVILGEMPKEVREFLVQAAYLQGAEPVIPNRLSGTPQKFSYGPYPEMSLGLAGIHQLRNLEVALSILEALNRADYTVRESELREGLKAVRHPGRLEWVDSSKRILLDGAHNPEAFQALAAYLREEKRDKNITLVLGMMLDKDAVRATKILSELKPRWIFTEVQSPRSIPISRWKELASAWKLDSEFFTDSKSAVGRAKEMTPSDGIVLVTGSLYLIGEVRKDFKAGSLGGI